MVMHVEHACRACLQCRWKVLQNGPCTLPPVRQGPLGWGNVCWLVFIVAHSQVESMAVLALPPQSVIGS